MAGAGTLTCSAEEQLRRRTQARSVYVLAGHHSPTASSAWRFPT